MAKLYSAAAWKIDLAALSAMAAVKLAADARAVSKALDTVYRPWLESAAEHFQELVLKEPLPGHDGQPLEDVLVEPGGLVLFADGLRFDVAQSLIGTHEREGLVRDPLKPMGWAAHGDSDGQAGGLAGVAGTSRASRSGSTFSR